MAPRWTKKALRAKPMREDGRRVAQDSGEQERNREREVASPVPLRERKKEREREREKGR